MLKKCEGCKFFSELIARYNSVAGCIEAVCLCKESPKKGDYVALACDYFEEGTPIDIP